jgi:FkbM family methyltransferase
MRKRIDNNPSPSPKTTSIQPIPRKRKLGKGLQRLLPICVSIAIFFTSFPIYLRKSQASIKKVQIVKNIADSKLARKVGDGWKVIDWTENANIKRETEGHFKCFWTEFKSSASGNTAEMCVHPFGDVVSGRIKRKGNWEDCDSLSSFWNENVHDTDAVYVEIGANIGSCVMEMLLGTNANIIAFEPHPMNVFVLQQTISKLDSALQKRVRLVPVGLGHKEGSSTIYSASNNMGNSIIGAIVKDAASQQFDEKLQFKVPVERLDTILKSDVNVKLMKMDAQGFECKIVEGIGQNIASGIDTLKFEYSKAWLDAQKCTDLLDRMRKYGFDIYRRYQKGGKFINGLEGDPITKNHVIDLFAIQKK